MKEIGSSDGEGKERGRNQTKVGLKGEEVCSSAAGLSEKKSDQGGIESIEGDCNASDFNLKKSDQGGIERSK